MVQALTEVAFSSLGRVFIEDNAIEHQHPKRGFFCHRPGSGRHLHMSYSGRMSRVAACIGLGFASLVLTEPAASQSHSDLNATPVYRAALDELYSAADSPGLIVLTDSVLRFTGDRSWVLPAGEKTAIYSKAGPMKGAFPAAFTYRIPVARLTQRQVHGLELKERASTEQNTGKLTELGFWIGFAKEFPTAWGLTTFSEVVFNAKTDRALLNVLHTCGGNCQHSETFRMTARDGRWQVEERVFAADESVGGGRIGNLRDPAAKPKHQIEPQLARDDSAYVADSIAFSRAPKDIRGKIINAVTGRPISNALIRVRRIEGHGRGTRTDLQGRFVFKNHPITNSPFDVFCPGQEPSQSHVINRGGFWPGALDSSYTITVANTAPCWRSRRARPIDAGELASSRYLESPFPGKVDGAVYRAVVDVIKRENPRSTILLRSLPASPCIHEDHQCGVPELELMFSEGAIDSVAIRATGAPATTTTPFSTSFATSAGVSLLTPGVESYLAQETRSVSDERRYEGDSLALYLETARQAYSGIAGITSLTSVAFDASGLRALVQARVEVPGRLHAVETMIVTHDRSGWRVSRRHVEKEPLSGLYSGNACTVGRARAYPADATIGGLAGRYAFELVSLTGSHAPTESMHVLFRRRPDSASIVIPPTFQIFDAATGARDVQTESGMYMESRRRQFQRASNAMRLHGEGYVLEVREVGDGLIFGSWRYFFGHRFLMNPELKREPEPAGYFCARQLSELARVVPRLSGERRRKAKSTSESGSYDGE